MELKRCPNGHYYDSQKHSACPYCASAINQDIVTGRVNNAGDVPETRPLHTEPKAPPQEPVTMAKSHAAAGAENKTVGFYNRKVGIDPVVGWFLCVAGLDKGRDFRIRSGRNFIGRSENMDICITGDKSISRDKHAIVVYDPKKNVFMLQPGESREMCYLNGDGVYTPAVLNERDIVELGETKLMFIPACGEAFQWE